MSGELNQISLAIGALQADAEEAIRQREAICDELKAINRKLETLPDLAHRVAAMEPEVKAWADARRKASGALLLLTACAGAFGFLGGVLKTWLASRLGLDSH